MRKLSLTDMKAARKWVVPAGIVALGFASAVGTQFHNGTSKAASTVITSTDSAAQATESPAPTAKPKVTVNGTDIPTDKDGSTDIATPGGKTHVEVSGGQTRVTTQSSGSGDTSNKSSNVNIDLHSVTTGGTSSGLTQSYGFSSSSNDSGTSMNSTSVFSNDFSSSSSQ